MPKRPPGSDNSEPRKVEYPAEALTVISEALEGPAMALHIPLLYPRAVRYPSG